MNRDHTIKPRVMQYLTQHANQVVLVDTLAEALSLPRGRVLSCLTSIRNRDALPVETLQRGVSVLYRPSKAETNGHQPRPAALRTFQEVGTTKDGAVIATDGGGTIYRLEQL